MEDNETSGEDIEVAKLLAVCWIDIKGYVRIINLSPGTVYEIVFEVKKFDGRMNSDFSFDLVIKPQHSKALTRTESFEGKPLEKWFELLVGEFMMSPEYVGNMEFGLEQHDGSWKSGLVVKCAIIRPKEVAT
ncbi:protein PHLOEM PROTEIN 2-LIKE A2-like [Rhododendron vialii]|uniref:protein PHLOEM PROTEIN 2-LIKE A2-like n=1 Tax=Rhododendron vialii TaxID=182163 RepID=UPI00265FD230|nr:protein PHLOEM PROTEIN 2-LIKE A2-like [Rhododendron vialii]